MIKRGLPWRLYQTFVPWLDVILTKCSGCKTIYGYCFPGVMFSRNVPGKARGDAKVTVAEILLWAEIPPEA